MKNLTLIIITLFFFSSINAQHTPWSIQATAGINQMETFGDFRTEKLAKQGRDFMESTGNVTEPVSSIQLGVGINYTLHPRWEASLQLAYSGWKGTYGEERFITFNAGSEDAVTHSPTSDRSLHVLQASGIAYFDLLGKHPIKLQVGTGLSTAFRRHYYETFAHYNFNEAFEMELLGRDIDFVNKMIWGVPFSGRIAIPLNNQMTIGAQGNLTLFTNEDLQQSVALLFTYAL